MVPQQVEQLHGAHLLSLVEIRREFGSAAARRCLTDERNVVALCRTCHAALDFLLTPVRDPRGLSPSQRGKLWKRIARHLPAFAALLGQRVRYRKQLRRERASGSLRPGAHGLPAASEEQLMDDAWDRFAQAMAARERAAEAVTA